MIDTVSTRQVDLAEVKDFVANLGYEVISLNQEWRHVTGKIKKEDMYYFFKLGSTPLISIRTQNEAVWSQEMLSHNLPIAIPQVIQSGIWGNIFWFIREYIDGVPLLRQEKDQDYALFLQALPRIVDLNTAIRATNLSSLLPNDAEPEEEMRENFIVEVHRWNGYIHQDGLAEYILALERYISYEPIHGDFAPWHFLMSRDRLYIIDAENARMKGNKFEDVGYMYHQLYTKISPELADAYLHTFLASSPLSYEGEKALLLIIGKKLLRGYVDSTTDGLTIRKFQTELKYRLLTNKIV